MRRVPGTGDEEASPLSGGNVADGVVRVGVPPRPGAVEPGYRLGHGDDPAVRP
jgi:hypothetical protein